MEPDPKNLALRPSRVRYRVLAFLSCLAAITYMDRVAISVTARHIMRDLHLSDVQMGFVFSAFTLAYGLFEIPTGWWGERIGTRKVLTRIVIWWSSFTVATAAAFSHGSLLVGPVYLRDGRSGRVAECRPDVLALVPLHGAGRRPGHFFRRRAFQRRADSPSRRRAARSPPLALDFRDLRLVGFIWAFAWRRWFRDGRSSIPRSMRWS